VRVNDNQQVSPMSSLNKLGKLGFTVKAQR
jgi:hypothetical protein